MALIARPLAGPGMPSTVLDIAEAAGWILTTDDQDNVYAFPPDHRLVLEFLPEQNAFAPAGVLWVIRAYSDLHAVEWQATFTDNTPAEFVAAFLADLIKPDPLDTERGDT